MKKQHAHLHLLALQHGEMLCINQQTGCTNKHCKNHFRKLKTKQIMERTEMNFVQMESNDLKNEDIRRIC